MTPLRPYLIRAVREWILDNAMTPQMLVDATLEGVHVPRQHVVNDRIILNFSDSAVQGLQLGDEFVEFNARFGGKPFHVHLPVTAVLAVASRENGVGMEFAPELPTDGDPPPGGGKGDGADPQEKGEASASPVRPTLRVVK